MLAQRYLYFLLQFIAILDKFINGNPLRGKNVELATKGEFPFVVSLSNDCHFVEKTNHFCGGTLISNRHVLTSAHCTVNWYISCITVIVGSIDFESGQIYKAEKCTTYDDWALNNNIITEIVDNDIAVVTLSQYVKGIVPAKISELRKDQVIGKSVVTAGWGLVSDSRLSRPDSLRKATLRILTPEEFNRNEIELFGTTDDIPANIYATAANPPVVVTCGDSGGPLLLSFNKEIVGINDSSCKATDVENNLNAMSLHIAVDYYRDFIESFLKK